jgi:FKBP-type peptidyl-prolyl cis-trans isomerase SlyD
LSPKQLRRLGEFYQPKYFIYFCTNLFSPPKDPSRSSIFMQVAANTVVAITYQLSIKDNEDQFETIEIVDAEEPMVFIQGMSGLPEAFEAKLNGLSAQDTFDFVILPEDGYGDYDEDAIVELPVQAFEMDGEIPEGMLEVGNYLPMSDDQGNRLQGRVIEVTDELVVMDFNHPLAEKEMHFKGQVLQVRAATESEIDHGHVHSFGGVEH